MPQSYYSGCNLLVVFVVLNGAWCLDTKEFQKTLPARLVWGVPGKDAELPCDITPALPNDNVTMIFWFKDNQGMPLYSLDARHGPISKASHLAMSDDLGSRSYFITEDESGKARLRIQNVNVNDEGLFRCRVDFVNSPTRNYQVNLTLVAQPSAPRVFDAEGREIKIGHSAGPFLEDRELFLSCQVTGGRPKPSLVWWFNGTILDSVIDSSRDSYTTVNQLVITSTPRYLKGAQIKCIASSSEAAGYISREIPLTVFLKPNKVKIVSPNDLLSISKSQNIRCETSGSYPPAKLTWLLDGRAIRNAVVTEEETESFTGSILSLNVAPDDDGKDLVCRADNPRFPGGHAEDRRQIHVAYPPRVSVELVGTQNPVRETTDVTLRCKTSATPPADSYSWYHNSHLIPHNTTAGILPEGDRLFLKNVKESFAGYYACSAKNIEGETYSSPMDLIVQFEPRCKKGYEAMRVGALPLETLAVQCHVDSVPEVSRFSWTYNTSKGVLPVHGGKIESRGDVSILRFTPGSDDVESLSCWASNSVGRQQRPCLFFITPAEAPESPKSCLVRNATNGEGLEVSCIAGKDGGLHQSFILEVFDVSAPADPQAGVTTLSDQGDLPPPKYRVLGERPLFYLHNLQPGKDYQVSVYAENAKGKSHPPVILPNVRIDNQLTSLFFNNEDVPSSNPAAEASPSSVNLTVIVVSLAAAAVVLIVSIISVAAILACRRPGVVRMRRRSSKPPEEFDLSEAGFGEGFHRRSAQYRASMYGECEERISRMIEGTHSKDKRLFSYLTARPRLQ
ncbi:unnamed protein product [Phyllotreta striolata]|uniref:Ig-like domain-containing protein n=1 Tax=Phyllotreta striolata TaxID=444603 RepID=A0A9N9TK88_PHYSR|nr:unnamed protein product [Phyllotreta striolata]